MEWKDVSDAIQKYAPEAQALLGLASLVPGAAVVTGPAALAVGALSKALGVDPTPDAIAQSIATDPNAALKLKQAELDVQVKTRDQDIEELKARLNDVQSAREREKSLKDNVNKVLAYSIVGAFIALVGGTLLGWAKVDSALAGTLVGYLSAKCEQVLAYYFGSSKGSAEKTALLAKAEPIK